MNEEQLKRFMALLQIAAAQQHRAPVGTGDDARLYEEYRDTWGMREPDVYRAQDPRLLLELLMRQPRRIGL